MEYPLTNHEKCVVLRNGIELWLAAEKAQKLQAVLANMTEHKFITIDGRTLNTADCTGIYSAEDMARQVRHKNGQWQCRLGTWHDKGGTCNCQDDAEQARRCEQAQAFHRQHGYYPLWY